MPVLTEALPMNACACNRRATYRPLPLLVTNCYPAFCLSQPTELSQLCWVSSSSSQQKCKHLNLLAGWTASVPSLLPLLLRRQFQGVHLAEAGALGYKAHWIIVRALTTPVTLLVTKQLLKKYAGHRGDFPFLLLLSHSTSEITHCWDQHSHFLG